MELWYDRPAKEWLEALPIGNGRLGAMVYGGIAEEHLQLNESTVWSGGPHDYTNPKGPANLAKIRELVFAEKWQAATELADECLVGSPATEASYQTVGDLLMTFDGISKKAAAQYRRSLDLRSSTVVSEFTANGVKYRREVFASFPDQLIVIRLTSGAPDAISFTAAFTSPQSSTSSVENGRLILTGISGPSDSGPGEVKFAAVTEIHPEGDIFNVMADCGAQSIGVSNADRVTILISIGSSYNSYKDVSGDPRKKALAKLDNASGRHFVDLSARHLADYAPLFARMTISLGDIEAERSALPTDVRIAANRTTDDPGLAALYCQYGRYLTIAGSRPGGLPTTLQGLWNNQLLPAWGSKYTININTEMNYWLSCPANLTECFEPLFDLISIAAESGARTARLQYDAGGWVAHHNLDVWAGTSVVDRAFHGMWPSGGAWLCNTIWDQFEFTGNTALISRLYPILKGASQFFLDTLTPHPSKNWLVTCPSNSPENAHHPDVSICAGPSMDMSILRDLFDHTVQASQVLENDEDFRGQVLSARKNLAPLLIGHSGKLQEWLDDWDDIAPEQDHRHTSHLYALHPGAQITPSSTPDLAEAARQTLIARGDESTGWATAWRILFWSRLRDSKHAHKLLSFLLSPERTAPNMFDLHPPFQIDGNFGGAAAILEMLVQSHEFNEKGTRIIRLLPALPNAWQSGSVSGVLTRGAFEISMRWMGGEIIDAKIKSIKGGDVAFHYNNIITELHTKASDVIALSMK